MIQPPPQEATVSSNNLNSNALAILPLLANDKVAFNQMLPTLLSSLLEQIQCTKNEPEKRYDMKVQKEISQIQGKSLMYTCPGLAVISSDGPGIENVDLPMHITDISMNQRFA